jgi:hypothetical protein
MARALASRLDEVYNDPIKYDVRVKQYFDMSADECSKSKTSSSNSSNYQYMNDIYSSNVSKICLFT